MENVEVVIVVFLDLKRAFETVDRQRMIMKLNKVGICDNELRWFDNFLKNRKQKTKFKNICSSDMIVPIGLPQGTALSVLLFILYINDLPLATEHANVIMFADDTTITIKAKTIEKAIELMNNDLERILKWLNVNKLKLNIDKTKWMLFTKKYEKCMNMNLKIGGNEIEKVNVIKYLGVMINDKLKMDDQIKKCVVKASYKVNMLKRLSNKLTYETRKMIYNTIVQPNFEYCSTLYLNATKEQIKSMQKIQNRGMRTILKCDYLTPKKFMLETLGWLSIAQKIKFNSLIMIYKMKNGLVPEYLLEKTNYISNVTNRTLRNSNDFRLPNYRYETTRNSIFYEGLKLFNEMPNEIKQAQTLIRFKIECKKYLLEKSQIS